MKFQLYRKFLKRPLDFGLALVSIIVFSPLFLIVAFLVRTKLGAPIFFTQDRPGKNEKIFKMYKFRSMTDAKDQHGNLLPDDIRLTKFGKFLRDTSLDELPGLFNILKGDMALIGPRPLLVCYLPLYNDHQKRRHEERPGLSGYAQVNGRNALSWEDKFDYDVQYVDNITFLGDVLIILKTLKIVFFKEDISSATSATMEVFSGSGGDECASCWNDS